MREVWKRMEQWLAEHGPATPEILPPAVRRDDLETLEARIGRPLPQDLAASLAIHDGTGLPLAMLGGRELLSARLMGEVWAHLTASPRRADEGLPEGAVRAVWWHPAWVPFATGGDGNYLCVDLDPAPGGSEGQVIEYWHDRPERRLVAPGFRPWLEDLLADLEAEEPFDEAGLPVVPEGPDDTDARRLLALLAERGVLGIRDGQAEEDLVRQVADILGDLRSTERRAEDLFHLLQKHPAVEGLRVDDEALEALLEAW